MVVNGKVVEATPKQILGIAEGVMVGVGLMVKETATPTLSQVGEAEFLTYNVPVYVPAATDPKPVILIGVSKGGSAA